jgi:murein DD-endopeptidase MepM/ murein hydrolase activator NlpD
VRVEDPAPLDVAPDSKFFFDGRRRPSFTFTASQPGPIQVEVSNQADGAVVAVLDWEAQAGENTATWDGLVGKRSAPPGAYGFRLSATSAAAAAAGPTAAFGLYDHVFPIRGRHNLGYTRTNQFGGGRGHQGIDMFAECGVDLAAARGGRVQYAGYHARAGNYAVIDGRGTGVDYTYMHMNAAPLVKTGDRVFTGQKIGEVGDSGNASGCHLHFEMWDAPGWYEGGNPFDPRPALAGWDRYS